MVLEGRLATILQITRTSKSGPVSFVHYSFSNARFQVSAEIKDLFDYITRCLIFFSVA